MCTTKYEDLLIDCSNPLVWADLSNTRYAVRPNARYFKNEHTKKFYFLGNRFFVGNNPKCKLHLTTKDIAQLHAEFFYRTIDDKVYFAVVDSSRHGTWVNGRPIESDRARALNHNDEVCFGSPPFPPSHRYIIKEYLEEYIDLTSDAVRVVNITENKHSNAEDLQSGCIDSTTEI